MKLEVYPNLTGLRGTERTIAHMRRLVEVGKTDPSVVLRAQQIVRGIDRNDQNRMASAIFDFVQRHVSYVRDPIGVEFVKAPGITLKTRTGDCDDQAVLYAALAESVGIKTRFKAIKADAKYPTEFSHVYAQAEIPGKGWRTADTIVPHAKFGWEAKGFPGRTWGGPRGMSYISVGDAASLGDATFAASTVGHDDEDIGSTFGDPFGEFDNNPDEDNRQDTGGSMWLTTPMLASDKGEISTIVDAEEDFWGGSADTPPGPGFNSRMLAPGVGALNVIQVAGLGGRWKPFKKVAKKIQAVKKAVQKVGERIQERAEERREKIKKGFERLGEKTADALGLSTDETRTKAARKAVSTAIAELWNAPGTQYALEVLRRAQDLVHASKDGRVSEYLKGPPPSMQGLLSALSQIDAKDIAKSAFEKTTVGATLKSATGLLKNLGQAKDQEAAQDALKKYVENFPSERLQAALEKVVTAYVAAGGMLPDQGTSPPSAWVSQFQQAARAGAPKDGGRSGYEYYDALHLVNSLEAAIAPLGAVRQVLGAAYQQHVQTGGAATIAVAANVVQQAIDAGTIRPDQAQAALAITKKSAEGFALTPEEQELAASIAAGARKKQGFGKGLLIAVPAAAAAAAALLI